ncbi:hypothetical protein BT96DRAFT_979276 [Gymnopus androsaceus JB14]|uniref:Uncharacterized protein n=1 Tax=Gymnopus androsaceus JB14 TaxID=1447944 RepID=A0A6A4H3G1_9AGAR|nr:hypothetical protein BT96DRAFT_979276 [Gymnopus androsaceus JB14]
MVSSLFITRGSIIMTISALGPTWKIVVVSVVVGLFLITLIDVNYSPTTANSIPDFQTGSRNTAPTNTSVPLITPSPPTYSIGYPNQTVYRWIFGTTGSFVPMKGDHVNDGGRHYPPPPGPPPGSGYDL